MLKLTKPEGQISPLKSRGCGKCENLSLLPKKNTDTHLCRFAPGQLLYRKYSAILYMLQLTGLYICFCNNGIAEVK